MREREKREREKLMEIVIVAYFLAKINRKIKQKSSTVYATPYKIDENKTIRK